MPSPERLQPQNKQENNLFPEVRTDFSAEVLEFADRLKLKDQYFAQVKVLYQSGILENLPVDPVKERFTPELGIIGIDGHDYIMPSYESILEKLQQNPETRKLLETKREQGFTKLQLVPFALPLAVLIERYKTVLLDIHHNKGGIKATDGSTLELKTEDHIYVWDKLTQCDNPNMPEADQMEYHVSNYDGKTKEQRGGKYKSELLQENPDNAWQVTLVEDNPDLPAVNKGKTIANRKQLEANKTPKEYLKLLQTDPIYQGESGQTPEATLITWLTYLQEQHTAIDDWQGRGKGNWSVEQFVSGDVPFSSWRRDLSQPDLYGNFPDYRSSSFGVRPAARFFR